MSENKNIYECVQFLTPVRAMPSVIIEGPKIDVETKRKVVKKLTEVIRELYRVEHVSVVIHENELENVGVDGELLSDIIARRRK